MKELFLTRLRDKSTSISAFREAADQLALLLASESGRFLTPASSPVQTPIGEARGVRLDRPPVLIAVLRSGLALLPAFLRFYPGAPVGLIGMRREEPSPYVERDSTAGYRAGSKPPVESRAVYHVSFPPIDRRDTLILLEPMVATGRTARRAVSLLCEAGAEVEQIALVSVLGAEPGIGALRSAYPGLRLHVAHIDPHLDPQEWIVPGLGDFGDRYFGT
jgi:uracil phosphoribosyltransferase